MTASDNSGVKKACWKILACFFLLISQSVNSVAQSQGPKPALIDKNGVLILIRKTLLALDDANKTGNYTVLRDLGAPAFQVNNPSTLADVFAKQRREGLDLSGVAVMEPQLTIMPQIEPNGLLRMAGYFPSVPKQISFELIYSPVQDQWKLYGISVTLGNSEPSVPSMQPQPATKTKAK